MPTFININPFEILVANTWVTSIALQGFLIAMAVLTVGGVLLDIKHKKNEQDDYGMMREVLNRRFKRAVQEKDNYLAFPDLVLVDGGKGQYSVARESLNELGLHDIPIIAIAKGKFRNSGNETFFHNGKEYKFSRNDKYAFDNATYDSIVIERVREQDSRVTEYYLVPKLGFLIVEVIDKKETSTERLKLQKILSLG